MESGEPKSSLKRATVTGDQSSGSFVRSIFEQITDPGYVVVLKRYALS